MDAFLVAANAMNASASIFEALSDVDSKFSKIADKEYDVVSTEVKKWFKKLAVRPLSLYLASTDPFDVVVSPERGEDS